MKQGQGPPKYIITLEELAGIFCKNENNFSNNFNNKDILKLPGRKTGISPNSAREFLKNKGVNYSFKVIAHINLRGGIGKTTSAITGATRAAQYGFKTCILDLDMQGSASLAFNLTPSEEDPIFYDVWQNPSEMLMSSLKKIDKNVYILPSSLENGLLDASLANPACQKKAVHTVCEELKQNGFELVFVDCPPSLSAVVISAICASDIIVIPVGSDAYSFKGLELTLAEIRSISETFNVAKPEIKILLSRLDRREKLSVEALERLKANYQEYLIPAYIRTNTEFSKALERRETVFASTRKNYAKDDYDLYLRHILRLSANSK
tara:strand:+ start:494 stop:1459 length:966 start_codon:yes stop_codon:yes gene_type:complete